MRSILIVLLSWLGLAVGSPSSQPYRVLKTAKVGGEGGWDFLTVDGSARRLYVTRGTHVMVLNADSLRVVGDIPATAGVHGVAIASDLGRGFTSNGRAASSTIFDLKTLKVLGLVTTGMNPDAIVYDAPSHRVFAFNGKSRDATVIDAATGTVAGTIPLDGKPEVGVSDGTGRIFVNLEDKSQIVAIDARKMIVQARWPLAPCEEPTGLAMDIEHRRLFSGCGNQRMAVVDADSGRVMATLPIGGGVDGVAFDPATQLAFSSNGEGTVTVVREFSPDRFEIAQNVTTQPGAKTIALDSKTHKIFLPTADFEPAPSPTPEQPHPRPKPIPGSFVVLVVGR